MSSSTLAQVINVPHKDITLAKIGIKHAGLQRRGQAWFCTTGLPSDVTVEVDEMAFHLHKFPLISRSGKLSQLIAEASRVDEDDDNDSEDEDSVCSVRLQGMPGGPDAFEQVAKFCYGVKLEISARNVATLRCASEYLRMTEEYGERNLISLTEGLLNHVILTSWKDSVTVLQSCEALLPLAEKLSLVRKCVNAIASKVCADPYNSATTDPSCLQSPDGTLLWNGISTGARSKHRAATVDGWFEDIAVLSLPLFSILIRAMEEKGIKTEMIAGTLMHYAKKHIPGLNRRREAPAKAISSTGGAMSPSIFLPCEAEQILLLETIESLLPQDHGVISTTFLFGLLKVATILSASEACKANLERRISGQLEQATLDDLLIPNYSYSTETLYDVECVHRLIQQFLSSEKVLALGHADAGNNIGEAQPITPPSSPSMLSAMQPLRDVARLLDAYLGEIAPDMNLKPGKFRALAECLPHYARALDDGLYRAIDIFIKGHSRMTEEEREALCSIIDCQKLSLEACTHATRNERLPLRVVVQVLYVEQMQLRVAIMGCLEDSASRPSVTTPDVMHAAQELQAMPPPVSTALGQLYDRHYRLPAGDVILREEVLAASRPSYIRSDVAVAHDLANDGNAVSHIAQAAGGRQNGARRQQHAGGLLSAHESQALRTDIVGLRSRIGELERECSRLRNRFRRKASGWASLSSKLTCRSIEDVSDNNISGPLQKNVPAIYSARSQPKIQPNLARNSLPSHPPLYSYSSSSTSQSFYSPSPHKHTTTQSFLLSPKV